MNAPDVIENNFGNTVTVQNPNFEHTHWTGKLIGYRDHPCVTLEFEDGKRMCLPAGWVVTPDA